MKKYAILKDEYNFVTEELLNQWVKEHNLNCTKFYCDQMLNLTVGSLKG